jgi:hypothetical protein
LSLATWVGDLEAVVDAAGWDRFALLGVSQGAAIAVDYAAAHPERVTDLVLYGGFARGRRFRGQTDDECALTAAIRAGWKKDDPTFRRLFSMLFIPDGTPEEEWKWVVDALKEVYDYAMKCGVKMAIEPLNRYETYFLNRGDQALALAKEVGPECGVCLDLFHMNIEEVDMFAAIRQVGKTGKLYDVHVAENNRLAPGMGNVDWRKLVATLREVGYDGALTMEAVAGVDRTPVTPWKNQVETKPVGISKEQLKFIQDHGSGLLSEEFYTMLYETASKTLLPLIR